MDEERERIRKEIFDKPSDVAQGQSDISNEIEAFIEANPEINPGLLKMFPPKRIERIMKKEARRYKAALEKKWRRWLEAVSR